MKKIRRAFLVAATTLAFAGASIPAKAADAWYVSVFGGGNFITSDIEGSVSAPGVTAIPFALEMDAGFVVGGAAGYTFDLGSDWTLSAEGELSYRRNEVGDVKDPTTGLGLAGTIFSTDGSVSSVSLMANAIVAYDFQETGFMPYIGGGIGVAFISANVDISALGVTANFTDDTDTAFAYQFIAGVAYKFSPNLIVAAEYRYFGITDTEFDGNPAIFVTGTKFAADGFQNHSILLRVTYRFTFGGPTN